MPNRDGSMTNEELRAHLRDSPGHNMGHGEPYNVHRLRTLNELRLRHAQDHHEEGEGLGHGHLDEPMGEGYVGYMQSRMHNRPRVLDPDMSPDMAPGMLVSELFDLPEKPRIQRVFHDRRG